MPGGAPRGSGSQLASAGSLGCLGGEDLGAWMVRNGWALAFVRYSSDYMSQELAAKRARVGIWAGSFTPPWDWRSQRRAAPAASSAAPAGGCLIKGNINRDGHHIYHLPGQRYYGRTQINPSEGEHWFCTEGEAQAAGWRRARFSVSPIRASL